MTAFFDRLPSAGQPKETPAQREIRQQEEYLKNWRPRPKESGEVSPSTGEINRAGQGHKHRSTPYRR